MKKHILSLGLLCFIGISYVYAQLECPEGWIRGWNKCYKIFYGDNKRSYARAREVCESYGSRLVIIRSQLENDLIGQKVEELAGRGEDYYIGLSKEKRNDCQACADLQWSNGESASDYEGFWTDNEPEDSDGSCVYARRNSEDYLYDRPYTWSYCDCLVKRNLVCERMAAPEGSFHCMTGGYINKNLECNGNNDCDDGSDELNCASACRYLHDLTSGTSAPLGQLQYTDTRTCTWAIKTPVGTNAYVQLNNFNTEYLADYLTVYVGNVIDTHAKQVDRISGNVGDKLYNSYNNMMLLKFTSDSSISNVAPMTGFTGTYGALQVTGGNQVSLKATDILQHHTVSSLSVGNNMIFQGLKDYVILIETDKTYQFGLMISLEVEELKLNDGEMVMFFDGCRPQDSLLATSCNDDSKCNNYKVIHSTGKCLSVLLQTSKTVTNDVAFRFSYRQGCYFETNDRWGMIYTPGFPAMVNYPNLMKCTWKINVNEPIALYFDPASNLQDADHSRSVNGDYLKMYVDGVMMAGSSSNGLTTADIAGKVFNLGSGNITLEFDSSSTRSARGFQFSYSTACPNPNYDDGYTELSPQQSVWHYKSKMDVSCISGYAFQQEQTQLTTTPTFLKSVTVECGYKGIWKDYLQIPKCTPKYCGDVPSVPNAIIESSTSVVFGGKATYKCEDGSISSTGSLEITCQVDGRWSNRPSCVAATCPSGRIFTNIINGEGELKNGDGTSIGTVYQFTCNAGFEFEGEPYVFCKADGTWTQNIAPSCKRLRCLLPEIENGVYTGFPAAGQFIDFDSSATVICNNGYQLANSSISTVRCLADRMLTTLPMCVDRDECSGSVCDGQCHNTVGSYYCTCGVGYQLGLDRSSCFDVNECNSDTDNCDGGCQNTQGSYTCSCSQPYVLYTANPTSGFAIPTSAGERGDLATDTYHINHTCVLISCPSPSATIENGMLLTKRVTHHYGDCIEYQCNIGYAPRRTTLTCGSNGQWDGTAPTCNAATCSDTVGSVRTRPDFTLGPYSYGQQLTLQCEVAEKQFNRYRHCTYSKENDAYEMQGSPYECGVVDCGTPKQEPGSNYLLPINTLYEATFEFTCGTNIRQGSSNILGSPNTVTCLAEGYWDFGDLQCTGQSCLDPGYPAGGSLKATSFVDGSSVTFECNRIGYTLSSDVTLTCQGTNFFGQTVPTCIDTQQPVISGCPDQPIVLNKYELLAPRLPGLTVADNTGIRTFEISPRNANSTLYVSQNMQVVYTATDFAGNRGTCTVQVQLSDETPPVVTCPTVSTIELETESSVGQFAGLEIRDVVSAADVNSILTFKVDGVPDRFTVQDLDQTYTYTVTVADQSNNKASCRGQIFVRAKPCSDLSLRTPLNADKTCTALPFDDRECVLTCQSRYTFADSKTKTVRCSNGNWQDVGIITACIQDVTKPEVRCPSSREITTLFSKTDESDEDFTILAGNVVKTDLNTMSDPVFNPERYTFRSTDLYRPVTVQVTVTDAAGNTGSCSFQYTAIPPVCSELSLPVPQDGSVQCTRRTNTITNGWDCTISCQTGKILRNQGSTKTVQCNDNAGWSDDDIYPACIDDTKSPVITCPASRTEKLYTGNEVRKITFATEARYADHTESDYSGIKSLTFSPPELSLTTALLNTAYNVRMTVFDNANNQASCDFQVLVEADACSPLGLPDPVNGQKACSSTGNGYQCVITCNAGYSFYDTLNSQITTTCSSGGGIFTSYIPDCVRDSDTANKAYIADMMYENVPENAAQTIPSSCLDYYKNKVSEQTSANNFISILDDMEQKMAGVCTSVFGPLDNSLAISFFVSSTKAELLSTRRVRMTYQYTISYSDPTFDTTCTSGINSTINQPSNAFPLRNIAGEGICPTLVWNNVAVITNERENCAAPYFQSLTDSNICKRCPAGTQSNEIGCTVCPLGTYRTYSGTTCVPCANGGTTRYVGSVDSNQCVAPCLAGQVSNTGYSPCYSCPVGTYEENNQCQACGIGETTATIGSTSSASCIASSSINDEPCTIGTQDIGNGNRVCQLCSVGTYRSVNSQTCIQCSNSQTTTYTKGAVSSTQCYGKCSQGFTSTNGRAPCTPCPKGQYAVSETTCETCPLGHTTVTDGSTGCVTQLSLRLKCPRGTTRNSNICEVCELGTYNAFEDGSCSNCDPNFSTYFKGATARAMCREKCGPGFYSSTGMSPCSQCSIGSYSSGYGANGCTSCGANTITASTTSTSGTDCIEQCPLGSFSYNGYNLNSKCRQCPKNHYQSQRGATSCSQCGETRYSDALGLTAFSQCLQLAGSTLCNGKCGDRGDCVFKDNEAVCECTQSLGTVQYYGLNCGTAVDYCLSTPCYNGGVCSNTPSAEPPYTCNCAGTGATGSRCEKVTKLCDTSQANPTCKNGGHCINLPGGTQCLCPDGFEDDTCSGRRDICSQGSCDSPGTESCVDVSRGSDLRRYCKCYPGYTGETCSEDIDECSSNPCINGGTCLNQQNRFQCSCPEGYNGIYCESRIKFCQSYNCNQFDRNATCVDVYNKDLPVCICNPGYSYDGDGYVQYQIELNKAPENLDNFNEQQNVNTVVECRNRCTSQGTTCSMFAFNTDNNRCYTWSPGTQLKIITFSRVNMYTKDTRYYDDDFYTLKYNLMTPTVLFPTESELLSNLRTVYGLNICGGTEPLSARCCPVGSTCLDNSGLPGSARCTATEGLSAFTTTTDYNIQFKCAVNRVFQRNDCRQKFDYCGLNTCKNGGNCLSVFGGYQCRCQTGYTGRNCQTNIDDCAGNPCGNGGTCEDKVGTYSCSCTSAYEGPNCNSPKNFCATNNCNGNGICRNIAGVGYECACYNGYEGKDCEEQTDYCKSSPCQHGGTCNKRLGSYTCSCVDGWQGTNCEAPVEQCRLQQSGGQCQGTECFNIFDNYYCKCEENSFGTNCQFKPNPCRDYSKCQNSAGCIYNGTMSCTCPIKYTGDGCEILRDYCGKDNPCENDGMCSVTSVGFECKCKPGYEGLRCENEIDECASVSCPGNGKCYDAVNNYYCRCPLKYTGTNCQKVFDSNYDMCFNHPQGYGYASIPYPTMVVTSNFITVTVWVRYYRADSKGVYLTQFVGDKLEEAAKFMEFDENGVRVYVQNGNDPYVQLKYDRFAVVNDGNWHLVTVYCDMVKGSASLLLDTLQHESITTEALKMPNSTFRMWVVLGCEFDNMDQKCVAGDGGFNGCLSQLNWYKSELTFEGDRNSPDVDIQEGQIPKIFRLPRYIFESNNLILVWYEYVFGSGVSTNTPSEAKGEPCDSVARSPPCINYRTTTLPSVMNCPKDMVVTTQDRVITVTWDKPVFSNLGPTDTVIKPQKDSGSLFTWGVYENTYIGIDGANNKAFCHFKITVTAGQCESPVDPQGGTQSCNTVSDRKGCMISCNAVNQNTYMIDREHPSLFTCGPSGWWNVVKPFRRFRYPSCGLVKQVPKQRIYSRLSFEIRTQACNAVIKHVETRSYEELVKLDQLFVGQFCVKPSCFDVAVKVTCGDISRKRRRRETPSDNRMLIEITLDSVDARTTLDGESISAVEFLTYFILGAETFNFDTVPNKIFQKELFQILTTDICPVGQVLRNGQCVECGPGNYFRYTDIQNTTAICDDCPLGSYQNGFGETTCQPCAGGFTTEMTGEYSQTSCKKSCPVGEFFNTAVNDCAKCVVGYYQDEVGQFRCKGCPAGFTTKDEGANSSSLCSVSCDSGYQLNNEGQCDHCPIGQYRNATETRTCVGCQPGYITANIASKSVGDCNIIACNAGYYRDTGTNSCKPCAKNSYQPKEWQTSCILCGDPARWRTENEASTQQSQCLYYCPSGYEAKQDPNRCDICPIGTFKDNTINVQGLCQPCLNNRRTEGEGATSANDCTIHKCPIGYKPNSQNTGCEVCPLGYYQDVLYSKDCKKCADGYSTRQTASTESGQCEKYCPSGEEKIGELCVPCKKGSYKNNILLGLFAACAECDLEYTTMETGSKTKSDCNIRTCPAGTKRNSDDTGCEDCPVGTYQPNAYEKDCISCGDGTSTRTTRSTTDTACETYCSSGLEKTSTGCVGCERGYYKNNENDGYFSPCKVCPVDYITEGENTDSVAKCNVGNCSAGQYLQNDKTCALCPVRFYQPDKWQTSCIECGKDKTTENSGSDEVSDCILECSPGYEDIGGSCQVCKRGFYKVESAATSCKRCPNGTTTESTGAATSTLCTLPACQAGQYLDRLTNPSSPQCRLCGYDTYQDEIWQEECKLCPNNQVTLAMGGDEQSDCVLDCLSGREYNQTTDRCDFCSIGYYRNKEDRQQTQCQRCPIDKITDGEGGIYVSECVIANCTVAGTYRNTATNECRPCQIGTYNAQKWVTSCTNCPLGNSTRNTGSASIDDCKSICPLGQYVAADNKCELCARGTYRSDMSTDACTNCPDNFLTPGLGANNASDCSISPCQAGYRYVLNDRRCVKCAVGTYQPSAGKFQCIDCPYAIKYTPAEGAVSEDECRSPCGAGEQFDAGTTSCVACPSGSYQPQPFQYTCVQCPAGRKFTGQTGAQRIEDCLSYCSAAAANVCSSNATCTVNSTNTQGYTCECFPGYEDIGGKGQTCIHQCDRGYCKNGGTCSREATLSCTCKKWYEGDRCDTRVNAESLSDNTLDIVIPVSIAAGGLILFLVMLAVCCLCWRRGNSMHKQEPQYSEYNGDRVDKGSIHTQNYMVPYDSRPSSRLMVLAPGHEINYDNPLYQKDRVITERGANSVLATDSAIYEA